MNRITRDFGKEVINEIEFASLEEKQGCEKVLATLNENASSFGRIMPPAGYEDQLLSALRTKIEPRARTRRFWNHFLYPTFVLPRWSLGLSMVIALVVSSVYVVKMKPTLEVTLSSVLLEQLQHSDKFFAKRWVASVGDPITVAMIDVDDPVLLSMEMGSNDLRKALTDLAGLVPGRISK